MSGHSPAVTAKPKDDHQDINYVRSPSSSSRPVLELSWPGGAFFSAQNDYIF